MALASAVELCRQTTSARCTRLPATRLSSICSTTRAPIGASASTRFFGSSSSTAERTPQRQHGHRLGMRLVDVFLHGVLDLRRQIARVAGVPHRVAAADDRRGQLVQQPHRVRTLIKQVLAADGLDLALLPPADRHADAIALDQPPALVGDRIGRLARIQRGVDRPGKILQLGPQRLAMGEVAKLVALQEVAGQLAHLHEEPQITLLRARPGLGTLEDLDQAHRLQVGLQQAEDQEELGRIGRHRFSIERIDLARPRVRRHQHPLAAGQGLVEQPGVLGLMLLALAEPRLLEVDLVLERELPLGVQRPHGPAHRRQRRDDPRQELAVKLLRRHVGLRQLGNLRHQRADLLLGLFDQLGVNGLFNAHICYVLGFHPILKGSLELGH